MRTAGWGRYRMEGGEISYILGNNLENRINQQTEKIGFGSYFNRSRIEPKIAQTELLTKKEKGPLWERL